MPEQRSVLEDIVQAELDKVGMRRVDTAAQYSVSVELRMHKDPRAPWDDPSFGPGAYRGFPIVTRHGVVYPYPGPFFAPSLPWYRREVSLLMRRLTDGELVFETHANSDGYWSDDAAVVPAIYDDIRKALASELSRHAWSRRADNSVVVSDGVVHLWGLVASAEESRALELAAEGVTGVKKVENHTVVLTDQPYPVYPGSFVG